MHALIIAAAFSAILTASGPQLAEGAPVRFDTRPVPLSFVRDYGGRIVARLRVPINPEAGERLAIACSGQPVGILMPREAGSLEFAAPWSRTPADPNGCTGWLIPEKWSCGFLDKWPIGAPVFVDCDGWAPGGTGVWLRASEGIDLQPGRILLRRVGRQPVQRCEVIWARGEVAYGVVDPLAEAAPISGKQAFELWPPPGDEAAGIQRSAVCFVDQQGRRRRVWIAAPTAIEAPLGRRVAFRRRGVTFATGLIEEAGRLFWRVGVPPHVRDAIDVGDEVVVRSADEIATRRFAARVYYASDGDPIVDAGETDGLRPGDRCRVFRGDRLVGQAELVRVQREYSRLRCEEGCELQPGDAVWFSERPAAETVVAGRVSLVGSAGGLQVDLAHDANVQSGVLYAVRGAEGVIGAVVLLDIADGRGFGVESPLARRRAARVGDLLVCESRR